MAADILISRKGRKGQGLLSHGLRKASATIAAESGATEAELMPCLVGAGNSPLRVVILG